MPEGDSKAKQQQQQQPQLHLHLSAGQPASSCPEQVRRPFPSSCFSCFLASEPAVERCEAELLRQYQVLDAQHSCSSSASNPAAPNTSHCVEHGEANRSKDGLNGVATFTFDQPSVFDSSKELGDITGLYLVDEEGVLTSVDVSAKFLNGKPAKIEAKYVMKNVSEWDRFMRFMERYATANKLGFVKK